ncbi:amidohydrolase family protein [Fodinicola acaciae]|uniref:amidohydrolase family protein n=1 Tax=Fodinicola acaciae TaxID=2681555 RepID=UPI001C9E7447|nr:amidohydrolase family protein [Fodinicola acaciae]
MTPNELIEQVMGLPLIDHHCHGVTTEDLDRDAFELLATESDWPAPAGTSAFDSPFGITVRAECAPLLDLPRHAGADDYLARRRELGGAEVTARLLKNTGISTYLVETGYRADEILGSRELASAGGARAAEVVRLESIAEQVAATGVTAGLFADEVAAAINAALEDAVGAKSIAGYRIGLDFDPSRPTHTEVSTAAAEWLRPYPRRLDHPVLIRHLLWTAVDAGKPIQLHTGHGDADAVLHRADPSLLSGFLRATRESGVSIMLLHCYPYLREAGALAQVYPHVYVDNGLGVNYTGPGSLSVIRASMEMTPFGKLLFSSDAFGLPELYACGALLWRRGTARVLADWLENDAISAKDALRYAEMIAYRNAERVYGL